MVPIGRIECSPCETSRTNGTVEDVPHDVSQPTLLLRDTEGGHEVQLPNAFAARDRATAGHFGAVLRPSDRACVRNKSSSLGSSRDS